jgi:hypothetical protein
LVLLGLYEVNSKDLQRYVPKRQGCEVPLDWDAGQVLWRGVRVADA